MGKVASRITELICLSNPNLTTQQAETIKFGLECILGETLKILIYFIVFSILSLTDHYLIAISFFCITRVVAGGYHANTYVQCFVISFFILTAAIFTGSQFDLPVSMRVTALLAAIILVWIFAPVDHPNKPIISIDRRKLLRRLSIIVFIVLSCITFLFRADLASTAVSILLLEAILLPLGQMTKRSFTNEYSKN